MANERVPAAQPSQQHDTTPNGGTIGEGSKDDHSYGEAQVVLAEAARNEAELLRRIAEETREVRSIGRRLKRPVRSENGCGTLPKRHERPAKRRGVRRRAPVMQPSRRCARPPRV
jgi:hypothetical protein